MDSKSLTFRSFKKLIPGGLGAAAAAATANFLLRPSIKRDRSFVTWSEKMPSYRKRPRTRRAPRRYMPMVRYRLSPMRQYSNIVRTTQIYSTSIPASGFLAFASQFIKLNLVKTSDLLAAYDLYKIRKVQAVFCPCYDPGNSGIGGNNQICINAACDPSTTATPTAVLDITAYDNHRSAWLVSGKSWTYTFYPKVINTVDNSGTATASGSYAVNPWLQLTTSGVDIPHRQLLFSVGTTAAPSVAVPVSFYFRIHFAVKNQR